MGFVPDADLIPSGGAVRLPAPSERPALDKPTVGAVVSAAFSQNNTVASSLNWLGAELDIAGMADDPDYDPLTPEELSGYEDRAYLFADSRSGRESERIKRRIDDEREARDVLGRSGAGGVVASIAAGIIDPVNLIPVGGWTVKGAQGAGIGTRVLGGVAVGAASASVAESILYSSQVERTPGESAANVLGSALLGGLFGGAGVFMSSRPGRTTAAQRAVEAEYRASLDVADLTPEAMSGEIDTLVARSRPAPVADPATAPAPPPFQFDAALSAVRSGYRERQAETLVEYLARTGGVLNNSDLSAVDAELWHKAKPFRRKLVQQPTGDQAADARIGMDAALERAVEQGYLPAGAEHGDLIEAVRQELAGRPVYSLAAQREASGLSEQVSQLDDLMQRAGVGLGDDDAAIRAGVRQYLADKELEDALAAWEAERATGDPDVSYPDGEWIMDGSLSAAGRTAGRDLRPAPALGLEKLQAVEPVTGSPILRTLQSPSTVTREVAAQLAETPYFLKGNDNGMASPVAVESRIRQWRGPLSVALNELDDLFVKYRLGRDRRMGDLAKTGVSDMLGGGGGKLSLGQFREEIARAMRRGDRHDVPEVAEAARALRARIVDPLKDEAIRLGLLPEGVEVTTAESYLTRLYDLEKISSQRNAFVNRLTDWFETQQLRSEDALSRAELRAEAEEVVATLLGGAPGRTAYDALPNLRGPLKERTLNVPDVVIEDFLENDVERVLRTYVRTMAADVEMARAFGRADMREQVDAVRASYDRLYRKTPDGPRQTALTRQMDRDIADLEGMRDRIRGIYGAPKDPMGLAVRTARVMRTLNYMRLLGGMTVSAIPDVARPVTVHGLTRTLRQGLLPLMTDLRRVKLSVDEVKLAGTALDLVLDTRAQQMADVFEDFGRYSKFERGVQYAGEKFGVVSLMSVWNAAMKQFAGVITQTRTLQAIEAMTKGAGKRAEVRRLRMLGIDDDMAGRIAGQFDKHGERGDAWWANTQDWTDREAAQVYRAALGKEVDQTIISPGQEKPLWMSTELGKTVAQFKSFTVASMSRGLIAGLQQGDAAFWQGMTLAVGLGMMTYFIKTKLRDGELSDNPAKWVAEGFDNSGMVGWAFEANNMLEKVTGGRIGVYPAIGEAQSSRYASRGVVDSLLGPSVGLVNDTAQTTGAVASAAIPDGDGQTKPLTRGDIKRMRRLLPMQNVFYLNRLFNEVEDGVGDALGLPEDPKRAN